jgi:nucleosome binding factor SPN SPT16 subunit
VVGDPTKQVEKNYKFMLETQAVAIGALTVGRPMSSVFQAVKAFVAEKRPDLLACLPKNVGFGLGLDFREKALSLNAKNGNVIVPNMVFNLAVGFQNIANEDSKNEKDRTYALNLAETVLTTSKGAEVLTDAHTEATPHGRKEYKDVLFEFKDEDGEDDEEEDDEAAAKEQAAADKRTAELLSNADLGSRRRGGGGGAANPGDASKQAKIAEHQKELADELDRDAKAGCNHGYSCPSCSLGGVLKPSDHTSFSDSLAERPHQLHLLVWPSDHTTPLVLLAKQLHRQLNRVPASAVATVQWFRVGAVSRVLGGRHGLQRL